MNANDEMKNALKPLSHKAFLAIGLMLILGAVNFSVSQKEQLAANGKTVLLQLAPVDPRSLMQGDYMRLDYAITRKMPFDDEQTERVVRLALDAQGAATTLSEDGTIPLRADEARMVVRKRPPWGWRIGSDAYFFQDGTAAVYGKARYGEYRTAESGDSVLVALRDEKYQRLGTYKLGYRWQVPVVLPPRR